MQRCAVRITYSKNKSAGQWRAHGRYVERESALKREGAKGAGFNRDSSSIDIGETLHSWQNEGDQLLFKMIVSPEFGQEMDLQKHTRELLQRMERDLNTRLEWVAAVHFNTDHPHVHVAIRGKTDRGEVLQLPKPYIKSGIRSHAQELATNQIGYRTQTQALQAQSREVSYQRKTSLDDVILRQQQPGNDPWFRIQSTTPSTAAILDQPKDERARLITSRLRALATMGLAVPLKNNGWAVRRDFHEVLKSMQKAQDRQKILAKHGVLSSDQRLPVELTEMRKLRRLEGRVLIHDEESDSGRTYMLFEGTDAKIHLIYHDDTISDERDAGHLRPGHFVTLRKQFVDKRPQLIIEDHGDADEALTNNKLLKQTAKWRVHQGLVEEPQGWGGWLGKYSSLVHRNIQDQLKRQPGTNREM
jgi:hypothetical protein